MTTRNATAAGTENETIAKKWTKQMGIIFHWVTNRTKQTDFLIS